MVQYAAVVVQYAVGSAKNQFLPEEGRGVRNEF